MSHTLSDSDYKSQVRAVWRATLWLTIITILEVGVALVFAGGNKYVMNAFFVAATLLKAYFIVAEFMHVRYETRAMVITLLAPTLFFIWFIIAFLWEGASWLNLRQFGF